MKTPILGSSYVARSVNAADNRMVNLFPEVVPEGGKEPAFLQRAPGTARIDAIFGSTVYGLYASQAYPTDAIVISDTELARFGAGGGAFTVGAISSDSIATFADFGDEVLFTTGDSGLKYVYNWVTQAVTSVSSVTCIGAYTCAYLNGRAYIGAATAAADRSTIQCSALGDPFTWDALDIATAESAPDGIVCVKTFNNELWVFGTGTTEIWQDQGLPGFPLAPVQGATFNIGCMCYPSVVVVGTNIFWLGRDQYGQCVVYRNQGYGAQRVSTHAIEWQIQQYDTPEDATAYTYQENGHLFYVINFTGGDATWVYDVVTGAWHQRGLWDGNDFRRHFASCAINFNMNVPAGSLPASMGTCNIVVGHNDQGAFYGMSCNLYQDAIGSVTEADQRWLRSWRAIDTGLNNLKRTIHHSLQIDIETGVGDPLTALDPQVTLRFSDNGGHTWSNDRTAQLGQDSSYEPLSQSKRVIFRRLGATLGLRDRVYELSGTDPCKIFIMGAELTLSTTSA